MKTVCAAWPAEHDAIARDPVFERGVASGSGRKPIPNFSGERVNPSQYMMFVLH